LSKPPSNGKHIRRRCEVGVQEVAYRPTEADMTPVQGPKILAENESQEIIGELMEHAFCCLKSI
jgi:hypothetical protein